MTLDELNRLPAEEAWRALQRCCAAEAWIEYVCERRPYADRAALDRAADHAFSHLKRGDWLEALSAQREPPGGKSPGAKFERARRAYEERFGHAFVASMPGGTPESLLARLTERLENDPAQEWSVALEEQKKVTRRLLDRMLAGP